MASLELTWSLAMKFVVVGDAGLIGSKVVEELTACGHDVSALAPAGSATSFSGDGLNAVLTGAHIVVDVSDALSLNDTHKQATAVTMNLLAAAKAAGVCHYVAVSAVGIDRLSADGYFRAKAAQEKLICRSTIPFSIVRATPCYEFLDRIADSATFGDTVRIPPALCQPLAGDDLAIAVAHIASGQPVGGVREFAGPERYPLGELIRTWLRADGDDRRVMMEPQARYFGNVVDDHTLVASTTATILPTPFADWLAAYAPDSAGTRTAHQPVKRARRDMRQRISLPEPANRRGIAHSRSLAEAFLTSTNL